MRILFLVVVALAAVGAGNAAVPTPAQVLTGFNVPSRNIVCNAGPSRGHGFVLSRQSQRVF